MIDAGSPQLPFQHLLLEPPPAAVRHEDPSGLGFASPEEAAASQACFRRVAQLHDGDIVFLCGSFEYREGSRIMHVAQDDQERTLREAGCEFRQLSCQ